MPWKSLMEADRTGRAERRASRLGGTTSQVFEDPITLQNGRVSLMVSGSLDKSQGVLLLKVGAYITETGERLDVDVAELAGNGLERDPANGKLRIAEGTKVDELGSDISATYVEAEVQAIVDKLDELIGVLTTMNVLHEEVT